MERPGGKRKRALPHCARSGGKVAYPRRKAALTAKGTVRALHGPLAATDVYRCRFCNKWHLTSQERP